MKKVRAYIQHLSAVLLLLVAVSVAPRQLFHDCDHTHTSRTDDHSESHIQASTDCAICDFHWLPVSLAAPDPTISEIKYPMSRELDSEQAALPKSTSSLSDRAPPAIPG